MGLGALVEEVCREENAQGKTLEKQIHDPVNKQILGRAEILGRAGVEVLHKLRPMGNETAHEMKRHDTTSIDATFGVVEHLLRGGYVLPPCEI